MAEQVVRHFINGEYRESASGKTFPTDAPEHGGVVGEIFEAGREEVDAAVAALPAESRANEPPESEWLRR